MKNILEKFPPEIIEKYDISVHDNGFLSISIPSYIGMYIEYIFEIQESEETYTIRAKGGSVSIWKKVLMSHVTI